MTTTETTLSNRLVTVDDVAAACYVSPKTVRSWMAKGLLPPAIRLAERSIRWHESTIIEWIASKTEVRNG